MKTSSIVARAVTRLFLLLVLLATIAFFQAGGNKLQHIYFMGNNKWALVFPALLLASFIGLFVYCTIKKFSITDLNWILVINTLVLMAYCATLYMRIYQLIK